ncbi:MAG TPA: hypothetical protein GXX15_00220 [Clostridia bacterium]|nr:hypothetical protein [Clostridia bacterium]
MKSIERELLDIVLPVITELKNYFNSLLREEDGEKVYIYDEELKDIASGCTMGQVAGFYVFLNKIEKNDGLLNIAKGLVKTVNEIQLKDGGFSQPYFAKKGEPPVVDIAEIGAVANSLYHIFCATKSVYAYDTLIKAADYLLTQVAKENPGAVYKRPQASSDVLNGDIYAAHAWCRAYQLSKKETYLQKVHDVIQHVASRFSKHEEGWWPYSETWGGDIEVGNSVSYQGTIVGFADICLPLLSETLRDNWLKIRYKAVETMLKAMKEGPNERTEVTWWSRDWENTWEIYLAFWRCRNEIKEAKEVVLGRFNKLREEVEKRKIEVFSPHIAISDPDRTPVSTTFRKAATFAGILSYMFLDEGII